MSYLLTCTVEWGRQFVEMTYEQLAEGIRSPEGSGYEFVIPPIRIKRSQFYALIAKLKERGVLLIESVKRKFTRIAINLDWSPAEGIMSPTLAVSKRRALQTDNQEKGEFEQELDQLSEIRTNIVIPMEDAQEENKSEIWTSVAEADEAFKSEIRTTLVQNPDSYKKKTLLKEKETTSAQSASEAVRLPAPRIRQRIRQETNPPRKEELAECLSPAAAPARAIAIETPEEIVQRVKAEHAATRAQTAEKARHGDHPRDYEITLRDAWLEAYPGQSVPTWTQKDCYVLRSTLKARFRDNAVLRHEFLAYTVKNWPFIMSKYFGWMRQSRPPEMPALNFLVREQFLPHFLDAFASSGRDQAVRLLPAEERELATLMDAGATREDALVQIAERRAMSKMEGKNREVRQLNREALMAAGEARRQREEAARAEMRRRAEEAKQRASRPSEPFPELAHLPPIKLIELPPLDLGAWS